MAAARGWAAGAKPSASLAPPKYRFALLGGVGGAGGCIGDSGRKMSWSAEEGARQGMINSLDMRRSRDAGFSPSIDPPTPDSGVFWGGIGGGDASDEANRLPGSASMTRR